jgi:hypothetical protein
VSDRPTPRTLPRDSGGRRRFWGVSDVRSHPDTCDGCGAPVLYGDGLDTPLEPDPVLPIGICGECGGKGTIPLHLPVRTGHHETFEPGDLYGRTLQQSTKEPCPACKGTGQSGEQPRRTLVALHTVTGRARPYRGPRARWECLHKRHQCHELPGVG